MTTPTTAETVVWDGTGHFRDAQPVMAWLAANRVEGDEIPLRSTITIQDDQIHFTRLVRTLDNKLRVTVNEEPAMESATAPLLVSWPLEPSA
jgi:hypothetical protein